MAARRVLLAVALCLAQQSDVSVPAPRRRSRAWGPGRSPALSRQLEWCGARAGLLRGPRAGRARRGRLQRARWARRGGRGAAGVVWRARRTRRRTR